MSRQNIAAIVAAVLLVVLVIVFRTSAPLLKSRVAPVWPFTSSTNTEPEDSFSPLAPTSTSSLSDSNPRMTAAVASVQSSDAATSTRKTATPAAPAQTVTAATIALDKTVGLVRGSIVNIICISGSKAIHSASGTGVIIDPRGVILTVAHMAQYFLLQNYATQYGVQCVIRTGSPAKDAYTADLAYIAPQWIHNNPSVLSQKEPSGTGEDDFALLAITGSATNEALPTNFSSIPLASSDPTTEDSVTIGAYGAEYLPTSQILEDLYPIVVFGKIGDRFTFASTTFDAFEIDGTPAAQEGSSGGAVVSTNNQLLGIITTSTITDSIATRNLHAITVSHMRRGFKDTTGLNLDTYLANTSVSDMVAGFAKEAKILTSALVRQI